MISINRKKISFESDSTRVITKFYLPGDDERITKIIQRILNLTEEKTTDLLKNVILQFQDRHRNIEGTFRSHFENVEKFIKNSQEISEEQKLLIGSYFTHEFSIQAAAFFNPSIVEHPDQKNLQPGTMRYLMSLRSVGEGHISSIEFRSGKLDSKNNISIDPITKYVETPAITPHSAYDKAIFYLKLIELGYNNDFIDDIFTRLQDQFTFEDLDDNTQEVYKKHKSSAAILDSMEMIYWIARSNDEQEFNPETILSERAIFPVRDIENNGLEDARFVRFTEDNGSVIYYATFSAYNGTSVLPMLLSTHDFIKFRHITLNGKSAKNKGMALFPRRIKKRYVMISRQDGENMYVTYADNINFWNDHKLLQKPVEPWEFVQIGNCGSPLETKAGWLLLTHGVGPMRTYCIGIELLDIDDPSIILGKLPTPIIIANEFEREGYVPNVVYSCGSIIHSNELVIPYAVSDVSSTFATLPLDDLLEALLENPVK